jgi:hypothetical protein
MTVLHAFDDHQRRAVGLLNDVISALEHGMHARDIAALASARRATHGFDRWFHAPQIRIGCGNARRSPFRRIQLSAGDLLTLDLAPASGRAFGDVGVTFAFRAPEPELVAKAREACRATCVFASHFKTVGELHVFARAWANNRQLRLPGASSGHGCLPPEGLAAVGYPRFALAAIHLRRHQIGMLNPRRLRGCFAIRVPVTDGRHTAVFEEMIWVDERSRRVLGRSGTDAVGELS